MNKSDPTRSSLGAAFVIPCVFTIQLTIGCAETAVDMESAGAAQSTFVGEHHGQLANWPMPDAVEGSKIKPSYSASDGDLLVVDNVTGLAWQRVAPAEFAANACAAGDGCTWAEAKAYCEQLTLGEYDDFRLPTKIELESIVDDTQGSPTLDRAAFPVADADIFWTASPLVGASERAWIVAFTNGLTFAASNDEVLRVRCVRTGHKTPVPIGARYTVDSTAEHTTVVDRRTGLVWQQELDDSRRDLGDAKAYCASLGSGWRLPTKKELLTLIDPSIAPRSAAPSIATSFPDTPVDANFWSSTPHVGSRPRAWLVNVSGPTVPNNDTALAYVRCVQ